MIAGDVMNQLRVPCLNKYSTDHNKEYVVYSAMQSVIGNHPLLAACMSNGLAFGDE